MKLKIMLRAITISIIRTPYIGRFLLIFVRARDGFVYLARRLAALFKWLITSRETTNYTYHLDPTNVRYLAALIADVTKTEYRQVMAYIQEIESDTQLRDHILRTTAAYNRSFLADMEVRYARRVGWYALVRIMKPVVVVETGVDKGLGACVLTSALKRNASEGAAGMYYGTDINPQAGYLLTGEYAQYGRILYGDSITTLKQFELPIDMFINDSDHSADYEAAEYRTILPKLSERAIILGDNAHVTDKLLAISLETERQFVYFQEKPHDHWYPGAGIGISFKRS
ncbi:MAG: class I SAM-dependent methyltransferase [Oscillochloris sp.]|nr:class I SAM-dependent methyltransferase [Oscillochloris sp.]